MKRHFITLVFATAGAAHAGIVSYEGDAFPETVGWNRVGTSDATREINEGLFIHSGFPGTPYLILAAAERSWW